MEVPVKLVRTSNSEVCEPMAKPLVPQRYKHRYQSDGLLGGERKSLNDIDIAWEKLWPDGIGEIHARDREIDFEWRGERLRLEAIGLDCKRGRIDDLPVANINGGTVGI